MPLQAACILLFASAFAGALLLIVGTLVRQQDAVMAALLKRPVEGWRPVPTARVTRVRYAARLRPSAMRPALRAVA